MITLEREKKKILLEEKVMMKVTRVLLVLFIKFKDLGIKFLIRIFRGVEAHINRRL